MTPDRAKSEERPPREVVWGWFRDAQFLFYSLSLVILMVLAYIAPLIFITVPTGYSAVMYRYFMGGTVTDTIWGEGLHVIPPWDTLTLYESRLIEQRIHFNVLSEEGLDLGVEISIRYRPNKDMLGFLHQDIGPQYYERLIKPEVESHVRKTFGSRPAHEIYASTGDLTQELRGISMLGRIDDSSEDISSESYIQVQEIKLVDIDLPPVVERYIAAKYGEEQAMLEYDYKLIREEKEAERKRIWAAGLRDASSIASSLSPDLLRWRDIDATLALAKSTNAKVMLLGSGSGDHPLIFNLGEGPSSGTHPAHSDAVSREAVAEPPEPETLAPAATVAPAPPPTTTSWDGSPLIQSIVSPSLPATPKKTKAERR